MIQRWARSLEASVQHQMNQAKGTVAKERRIDEREQLGSVFLTNEKQLMFLKVLLF